jgi:hypothetical protein
VTRAESSRAYLRTVVLGSNQDPGPDDRNRKDDDQQVDGEPLRNTGHGLVLQPALCVGRGWANVNQFTRDTKFSSSSVAYRVPLPRAGGLKRET